MITTNKLKQFKEALTLCQIELDELLRYKKTKDLFSNKQDYDASLYSARIVPDDYYYFRYFDSLVELKYNSRLKSYYILFDTTQRDIYSMTSFLDFCHENKLNKSKTSDKIYNLTGDKSFDDSILVFKHLVQLLLTYQGSSPALFYYD